MLPIRNPGHFAIRSGLFLVVAAAVVGDFEDFARARRRISGRGILPAVWRGRLRRLRGNHQTAAAGCSNGLRARWRSRASRLRYRSGASWPCVAQAARRRAARRPSLSVAASSSASATQSVAIPQLSACLAGMRFERITMSLVRVMPTIFCSRAEPPDPGIWPSRCSGRA